MRLSRRRRPATWGHFGSSSSAISAAPSRSRSPWCATRTTRASSFRTPSSASTRTCASFQGGSSFFTWLYRIITNLSIDLIRKPGRQTTDLEEARLETRRRARRRLPFLGRIDGADPADVVRRREIAASLQTALDALPSYHRGVIVMRGIDGLSYEEMAQAMGVSKGTIMSRLFHARQKLQRALADCYKEQVGAPRRATVPSPASEPASES